MEKSKVGMKKRSPNGQSHSIQNNINIGVFNKYGKV